MTVNKEGLTPEQSAMFERYLLEETFGKKTVDAFYANHRPSAFALIRCDSDLFLATSRRDGEELNPPGGKIDSTDHDSLDAAIREVKEEIGVKLSREGARFLCQSAHAVFYMWDLPNVPAEFHQQEPGIKVAAVPLYVFRKSQYRDINRDALSIVESTPRDLRQDQLLCEAGCGRIARSGDTVCEQCL